MSAGEIEQSVDIIISRLKLKEKIYLISGNLDTILAFIIDGFKYNYRPWKAGGLKRWGIPPVKFVDGPRGVVCGRSTCFPVAMARGASWDKELEERIGQAIGREIRAHGGNYFGGVCINLLRHPAWGRAQETYGEDPYLLGEMGAALTRGVQHHNVMACVKHYAANNIENSRFQIDVRMDERTLREVYLPHFRRCIEEGAFSVMGAYNKFHGEYCCENPYLLRTILKEEWNFDGFTLSDFLWGVRDAIKAINAGMDLEMPFTRHYKKGKVKKAVREGLIKEETIDEAVKRILRKLVEITVAEDPQEYDRVLIACDRHVRLAREAAEKSMVLLKNEGGLLPLDKKRIKKLALIGELAEEVNLGDHGSSRVRPPYVVTIREGLQSHLVNNLELLHCDGKNLEEARDTARQADAVIVVAGYRHNDEGEYIINVDSKKRKTKIPLGGDRQSIALKQEDINLINAVAPQNANTVVTLICGSAITMEEWKDNVPAILMGWYHGMEGGHALARILFGEVNPSGKLPFTIPARESDLPYFHPELEEIECNYYHGYTLLDKQGIEAAFPFGFGLTYTNFEYSNLQVEAVEGVVKAVFELENTGDRAGEEIVQLYIGLENSAVERPGKILRGFKKVYLAPEEKTTITMEVSEGDLAWYNPDSKAWEVENMEYKLYVGPSSRQEKMLVAGFEL